MKNALFICLFALVSTTLSAQLTSGSIVYKEKMDIHSKLPPMALQFKDRIPQFKEFTKTLWFNPEMSKYATDLSNEEEETVHEGGGMRMRFSAMKDNSEIVHDIKKGSQLEYKDFMGRTFLIEDESMADLTWKIGAGQKEILGYVCQEAIHYGKDTVLAWFAPQIPVATGPRGFSKLPGMILGLEFANGFLTIEAQEVSEETLPASEMKISGKGKKVTKKEFEALMEEKKKEMEEAQGGNGMVIKVRH